MQRDGPGGTLSLLLQVSHSFSTFDGPVTAPGVDLAGWDWVASRRSGAARRHAGPGQPSTEPRVRDLALLPGWRVVALREIDGGHTLFLRGFEQHEVTVHLCEQTVVDEQVKDERARWQ